MSCPCSSKYGVEHLHQINLVEWAIFSLVILAVTLGRLLLVDHARARARALPVSDRKARLEAWSTQHLGRWWALEFGSALLVCAIPLAFWRILADPSVYLIYPVFMQCQGLYVCYRRLRVAVSAKDQDARMAQTRIQVRLPS